MEHHNNFIQVFWKNDYIGDVDAQDLDNLIQIFLLIESEEVVVLFFLCKVVSLNFPTRFS